MIKKFLKSENLLTTSQSHQRLHRSSLRFRWVLRNRNQCLNTINIFGGHTSNGKFDTLFVDKNPQPLLNGVASAVTDLGDVRTQHESSISLYTFDQSEVHFFLSLRADVDLFTEDDQEIEFPNTISTSGSLIISEVSTAGLSTYTNIEDIILGPLDKHRQCSSITDDPNIDLTILPPTDVGSFMGGVLSVTPSPNGSLSTRT